MLDRPSLTPSKSSSSSPQKDPSRDSDLTFVDLASDVSASDRCRKHRFFHHYRLLLWKSFLLRRREPWVIVGELLLPLLLLVVILAMRYAELPNQYPPCHLVAQPLPSMGFLAYMKGLVCNFNFSCSPHDVSYQSQDNLEPSWLRVFSVNPEIFADAIQGLPTNEALLFNLTSEEFLCRPLTLRLLQLVTSPNNFTALKLLCSLWELGMPMPAEVKSVPHRLMANVADYLPSPEAVRTGSTAAASPSTTPIEELAGMIRNVSIMVCGKNTGSNSYLEFVDLLLSVLNNGAIRQRVRDEFLRTDQTGSQQAVPLLGCSQLNNIFAVGAPYTFRLKAALQGHTYYYPNTDIVNSVVTGANSTAEMLARLKVVSNQWLHMKDTFIPDFFNSSLVKGIRSIAFFCSINIDLDANTRLQCSKLLQFLASEPMNGFTHWTDLLPLIDIISAALDDILNNCVVYDRFHGFATEADMMGALTQPQNRNQTLMAIDFQTSPTLLSMRVRFPPSMVDGTFRYKVLDKYWTPATRNSARVSMKYFTSGFIDLQDQMERAFINLTAGVPTDVPAEKLTSNEFLPAQMQFVPGPCYEDDPMLRLFSSNVPMVIVIIWICTHVITVRAVVYEKELRLKEFTKVMGMSNTVHWLNWFTVGFIMLGSSSMIATMMLKFGQVYPNTEFFLLFCCFVAFILAILPQAFLISVFFNNANFAAVFAGIFYFIMFIPFNLVMIYDFEFLGLFAVSLFPQSCLAMTFQRLSTMELQGFGGQWATLWVNDRSNDDFSVGNCMLMLLVDGLIAWIGVWYLENVVHGTYGLSRKWYFPFQKSYWKEVFVSEKRRNSQGPSRLDLEQEPLDPHFHEAPDGDLPVGVSVRGLTKLFGRKKFVAVDNLWVDFYENQITAFLGHNGAGKTTSISILTGMYTASAGTAFIYDKDITTDMVEIRHHLGLCPQHNILFDKMTVAEHIKFYGALKGLSKKEIETEVATFLAELGLEAKANELAKNLSGGQKRRLSIAAAFVGGSKIVFLDEPTAGVDPSSRRDIWNLIFRFKESRTIILTTHHMDEADVLGDRIAIISQGHLKASGSSLFLKSNFAKYYYLNMEKPETRTQNDDAEISRIISERLDGSELLASNPTEWIFTLPAMRAFDIDGFAQLFAYLEENKERLERDFGVKHMGLTDTTLEEIFILLADDPSQQEESLV